MAEIEKSRHRQSIVYIIHKITDISSKFAQVLLFIVLLLTSSDVFGRYVLNHSIGATSDIVEIGMIFIVFLGMASVEARRSHIAVDVATSHYSRKIKLITHCIASFAGLVVAALMTWQLAVRGLSQLARTTVVTNYLEWPIAPFLFVASLGAALLCLELIVSLVTYVTQLLNKDRKQTPQQPQGQEQII